MFGVQVEGSLLETFEFRSSEPERPRPGCVFDQILIQFMQHTRCSVWNPCNAAREGKTENLTSAASDLINKFWKISVLQIANWCSPEFHQPWLKCSYVSSIYRSHSVLIFESGKRSSQHVKTLWIHFELFSRLVVLVELLLLFLRFTIFAKFKSRRKSFDFAMSFVFEVSQLSFEGRFEFGIWSEFQSLGPLVNHKERNIFIEIN